MAQLSLRSVNFQVTVAPTMSSFLKRQEAGPGMLLSPTQKGGHVITVLWEPVLSQFYHANGQGHPALGESGWWEGW